MLKKVLEDLSVGKRAYLRDKGSYTQPSTNAQKIMRSFGYTQNDIVGFLATKNNKSAGYIVLKLNDVDLKHFGGLGENVYRVISEKTLTTSIVRINREKGTIAFLDNEAYENGTTKFSKAFPYNRFIIDGLKNVVKPI